MASRRSLSLASAFLASCLLLAWNLLHDQLFDSLVVSLCWLAAAVLLIVLAVRLAWLAPLARHEEWRS